MPKRGDGNEQDIRVRPALDAHSLDNDNPMTGAYPEGSEPCADRGTQIDITVPGNGPTDPSEITLEYDWSDIAGVCPGGFYNRALDNLIMKVLKNHFGNPDNIIDPNLKQFVYTDNQATSGIRIVMNTTFDGANESRLPALVVKRLAQKSVRMSMGDRGERTEILQGIYPFVRGIAGSHQIICAGNADGLTESLANEVFYTFTALSPVLRTILPLLDFECTDMGELGITDELGNNLVVPIVVAYKYEYGWTTTQVSADFTTSRVELTTNLSVENTTNGSDLRTCEP